MIVQSHEDRSLHGISADHIAFIYQLFLQLGLTSDRGNNVGHFAGPQGSHDPDHLQPFIFSVQALSRQSIQDNSLRAQRQFDPELISLLFPDLLRRQSDRSQVLENVDDESVVAMVADQGLLVDVYLFE